MSNPHLVAYVCGEDEEGTLFTEFSTGGKHVHQQVAVYGAGAEVCKCATRKGEPSACPQPRGQQARGPAVHLVGRRHSGAPRVGVRSPCAGQLAWRRASRPRGRSPARAGAQAKRAVHGVPRVPAAPWWTAAAGRPAATTESQSAREGPGRKEAEAAAKGRRKAQGTRLRGVCSPRRGDGWPAGCSCPPPVGSCSRRRRRHHDGVAERRAAEEPRRRRRASAPAAGWSGGLGQLTTTAASTLRREGAGPAQQLQRTWTYVTGWPVRRRSHGFGAVHASRFAIFPPPADRQAILYKILSIGPGPDRRPSADRPKRARLSASRVQCNTVFGRHLGAGHGSLH